MRMLDFDTDDVKNLSEITEKKALEFLESGKQIVCRTNSRDFHEISEANDLKRVLKLKEEGIYSSVRFYIE